MNIAVLVSGNGSNLQALIDAETKGDLGGGKITLVVSDKPAAYALERARKANIGIFVAEADRSVPREDYDRKIVRKLQEKKIGLVILAGFMRILSPYFVDAYEGCMLNIHPALLPAFKGAHGIKDALEYGVKITGVTVHFVNKELDAGPVILQECVRVEEQDTLDMLEEKLHVVEHRLYPEAVRLFVGGKLKIEGRKVRILP